MSQFPSRLTVSSSSNKAQEQALAWFEKGVKRQMGRMMPDGRPIAIAATSDEFDYHLRNYFLAVTPPPVDPADDDTWERLFFYEYQVKKSSSWSDSRRFRCPVCHEPLRQGLSLADKNHPEETLGDYGGSPYSPDALVCRKRECRALLILRGMPPP
jgi:hypothetical protein